MIAYLSMLKAVRWGLIVQFVFVIAVCCNKSKLNKLCSVYK